MILHPAVTVHGAGDALSALASGRPVTLISAPGAALGGGCLWWRALTRRARAAHPDTPCMDILDCADAAGRAMAALRIGQRIIVLSPACAAWDAVAGAASTLGATVLRERPAALDMRAPGARGRLEAWLGRA